MVSADMRKLETPRQTGPRIGFNLATKSMQIRVGFEMEYQCRGPTPMVLALSIHYSRASDLVRPDHLVTHPAVPVTAYRDLFGNWCSRLVAPPGRFLLSTDAVVNDSGLPDVVAAGAMQTPVEQLPEATLVFLLGSRYCETDQLSDFAWEHVLLTGPFGLGARAGDLRLRPPAHRVRLSVRHARPDRVGGLQRSAWAYAATLPTWPSRCAVA